MMDRFESKERLVPIEISRVEVVVSHTKGRPTSKLVVTVAVDTFSKRVRICSGVDPFSVTHYTPQVMVSDNGKEFRSVSLEDAGHRVNTTQPKEEASVEKKEPLERTGNPLIHSRPVLRERRPSFRITNESRKKLAAFLATISEDSRLSTHPTYPQFLRFIYNYNRRRTHGPQTIWF